MERVIVGYCKVLLKCKKGVSVQSKSVPPNEAQSKSFPVTKLWCSNMHSHCHGPKFLSLGLIHEDHRSSNPEKALPSFSFPSPSALPLWHPIKTLSIHSDHNKWCWTKVGVKTTNSRPWVSTGDLETLIKSVFDLDDSETPNPGWFVGPSPHFPDLPALVIALTASQLPYFQSQSQHRNKVERKQLLPLDRTVSTISSDWRPSFPSAQVTITF